MIPGEIITRDGDIELNAGQPTVTLDVANTGDRPIQVGSHYHFYETNSALQFDREKTRGMRLDIAAGSAVRFRAGPNPNRDARPLSWRPPCVRLQPEGDGGTGRIAGCRASEFALHNDGGKANSKL